MIKLVCSSVLALAVGVGPGVAVAAGGMEARGQKVFSENCAVCHYPDRTETKVGPGLKGLFDRELTPVENVPVTEENIRERIHTGGKKMPPYKNIQGQNLEALLAYLKSL